MAIEGVGGNPDGPAGPKGVQPDIVPSGGVQKDVLAGFKTGDLLEAKIIKVLSDTDALVDIGGQTVTAKTALSLSAAEGESVLLKVLGRYPSGELALKLVGGAPPEAEPAESGKADRLPGSLKDMFGELKNSFEAGATETFLEKFESLLLCSGDVEKLPGGLKSALENLLVKFIKSDSASGESLPRLVSVLDQQDPQTAAKILSFFPEISALTGDALKEALFESGILFEAKLLGLIKDGDGDPDKVAKIPEKDLKTLLLKFRELSESGPARGQDGQGARIADDLLKNLLAYQLLSRLTGALYNHLPVRWDGFLPKDGQVAFKAVPDGAACLINLDLAELGKLAVSVFMRNAGFYVTLRVENQGFRDALQQEAGTLKDIFLGDGLALKVVNVTDYEESARNHLEFPGLTEHLINIKL